ncbi:MAG: transcriptional regulator [Myxococcaceae bacterium]|nr:transcriptional regulator [Myxococcaceae bacterium]
MRLAFDGFEIDSAEFRLLRGGREVALERRALDMLIYLATRPGRLIGREELISEVWQARSLSEGVLANTVAKLRKALGQAASDSAPIETVRGRGYRWHGRPHSGAVAPPSVAPDPDPFVGRGQIIAVAEELLERVQNNVGGLLVFRGAAGIGKTRLLRELGRRAREHGFSVWTGAAHDGVGAPPYWPWFEVLRAACQELSREDWLSCQPADASALPRVAPELFRSAELGEGAPSAGAALDPQVLRFRLFDELRHLLGALSSSRPRVILLDDLHWADAATIELLGQLASALSDRPLIFAAGVRRDAALDESLATALRGLSRAAKVFSLRGLEREEVGELVRHWAAVPEPTGDTAHALFERTGGNPYFVRQLVELARQRKSSACAQSAAPAFALPEIELPEAVQDVLRLRLVALAPPTREVLAVASVIGAAFDLRLLGELLGRSPTQLLALLEPARKLGLLHDQPRSTHELMFEHALLRDVVYDELPLAERATLHGKLLSALTARGSACDARQLLTIARHALQALSCPLASVVEHSRRACVAARAAGGFQAAADLTVRALARLCSEGGDPQTRCELMLQLGFDRYCMGDLAGSWQVLSEGAQLACSLGLGEVAASMSFRLLDCTEAGVGEERTARAIVEQTLTLLGERRPELRAVLLAHLAELRCDLPFSERCAQLAEAERLSSGKDAPELQLEIATCRVNLRHPTELTQNRAATARLRMLLRDQPRLGATVRGSMQHFAADLTDYLCALTEGDLASADRFARQARRGEEQQQLLPMRVAQQMMAAGRALGDGRLADLARCVERLRELAAGLSGGMRHSWIYYTVLLNYARKTVLAMPPLPVSEGPPGSRYEVRAQIAWAWLQTRIGTGERAGAQLAHIAPEELGAMPVMHGDLGTLCQLAETVHELDDRERAEQLHAILAPHAHCNAVGPALEYYGAVAHYLALLAPTRRAPGAARAYLEQAAQINERLGMPLQLARTRALLGAEARVR